MKKLKIILQCNWFYYLIVLFTIIFCSIYVLIPHYSRYDIDDSSFEGEILDIYIDGNYLSIQIQGKEKLQATYYFKTYDEKINFINNYELGDTIYLKGTLSIPDKNTNFNTFDYKKHLYYEKIFYILQIDNYYKVDDNNSILYKIKNAIIDRVDSIPKSRNYLKTLILGDDSYLSDEIMTIYQNIGISHLLAFSGMHIGLFAKILHIVLKKLHIRENTIIIITMLFLIFYMFLIGFSPSVMRAVIFFNMVSINKLLRLNIKIFNLYLLTISIIVLSNPFIIFKVGFQFSCVISAGLILFNNLINSRKNYIMKLFVVSLISFMMSMPILLYNFYQLNLLSVVYNLIFVPFMSFILFPISILTFIFPCMDSFTYFIINIFESLCSICNLIPSVLLFKKLSMYLYILYLLLVFIILHKSFKNILSIISLVLILITHYYCNNIFNSSYMIAIDVQQGDSILLHLNGINILLDTGGKVKFNTDDWALRSKESSFIKNTTVPMLKSFGINKLNYLILTHGDYDHMGEAINLVESFKVEKVIFNCGKFNELEQELIKVLDNKKIPYYSCIKELNIDDNKLYFLNNKDYGNENDNSSVIYTELNNHKFLFMGDAGVEVEQDLIKKYNLQNIDVLKVGHHGSKTSSGKEFIDEIKPKYSIISVGKNNRYGHPNHSVLDNLNDSKIYRTDQDGSIMFKIKNNRLSIETCTP